MRTGIFLILLLLVPTHLDAEDGTSPPSSSNEAPCSGDRYRAKRNDTPVYDEPATTGRIVKRLSLGERVCYLGEKQGFAIIDRSAEVAGTAETGERAASRLAYVRVVDLWESKDRPRRKGLIDRMKSYYYYIRSGGVPDSGLIPYDSLSEQERSFDGKELSGDPSKSDKKGTAKPASSDQ